MAMDLGLNYALLDGLTIVLPSLISIFFCWAMFRRSYQRATEIGLPKADPKDKALMKNVLLVFLGVPFAYSLLELMVYLSAMGCFNGTYSRDNLTAQIDFGCQIAGFGGFILTFLIGLTVIKRNRQENTAMAAKMAHIKADPNTEAFYEEIRASRDPKAFRSMMTKLILLEVLCILLLALVVWTMKSDPSAWEEAGLLLTRTI